MPQNTDKFAKSISGLEEFCRNLNDRFHSADSLVRDDLISLSKGPVHFFQDSQLGSITLSGPDVDEYHDCLLNLYEVVPHGQDAISLQAVESAVHEALLKIFSPKAQNAGLPFAEKLKRASQDLRDRLRQPPRPLRVHFQVDGLVPNELPRTIGDIEFCAGTHPMSQFVPAEAPSQKIKTYARVLVVAADPDAAIQAAIRKVRQTLDLLNYFGHLVGNHTAYLSLPWEGRAFDFCTEVFEKEQPRPLSTRNEWRGAYIPFYLNLLFDNSRANKAGFSRAIEILTKANRSKLEERLLSAIQWAGRASVEERREEAIVLFAVALESVLMRAEEKDQVTQRFATRGALLIGKDFASRKIIYDRLKKLYGLRSAIIHSGSTDIADADRDTMAYFVKAAILTLLVLKPFCEMQKVEDLFTWFEDKILGRDESVSDLQC